MGTLPEIDLVKKPPPPVGYYFGVNFLLPVPDVLGLDMRFQRVSGLEVSMRPQDLEEGGKNLYVHRLPTRYTYGNLVLERGLPLAPSVLNTQFQLAMSTFSFITSTLLVTLINESDYPVAGWLFTGAYPVRWATSPLDANENKVVIDTLEMAYSRFQRISL